MIAEATLLYPLDAFYARAGLTLPSTEEVSGDQVPEPYRSLLVHERDMTPTLEKFHGEHIHLRTLERRLEGETLLRQVVLTLDESLRPVEYGAIAIHLDQFPEAARPAIRECRQPLGTILAVYEVRHFSQPQGFFRVEPDGLIREALGIQKPVPLYGRRNVLATADGAVLADVVEIIPPLR